MSTKLARLWATKGDEWWSSFATSPMAIGLNCLAVDIKWLTPNKITLISFITAIIAAVFIIFGGSQNFIIAALLIHLSHVFDCMDGQMARYRKTTSVVGGYYDKLTDEIQVALWFGATAYAAFSQTQQVLPVFLAFIGVASYSFRGYVKYAGFHTQMSQNSHYLIELAQQESAAKKMDVAGLGFGLRANLRWFIAEQRKIVYVNEGVFIVMLSSALILDSLTPMLWFFALSQFCLALGRAWFKCHEIAQIDS